MREAARIVLASVVLTGLAAGCGVSGHSQPLASAPTNRAASPVPRPPSKPPTPLQESETAFPILGVGRYILPVPASYATGNHPSAQLVDLPEGAVWVTPAGFPGPVGNPLHQAYIWLSPWHKGGGNLWRHAKKLGTIPHHGAVFSIVGESGSYAVFQEQVGHMDYPLLVNVREETTRSLVKPITGPAIAEDGFLVYQSGSHLIADRLSTRQLSQVALAANADTQNWTMVSGGMKIGAATIRLPEIPTMPTFTIPSGYKWLGPNSQYPLIAVPANWTIVRNNPEGSSATYSASAPSDPEEDVTIQINACVGCVSAAPLGGPVNAPDSPVLGAAAGTFSWLNDHIVATQRRVDAGWSSTTETIVWPSGASGNVVVSWTVPPKSKHLVSVFTTSLLTDWRDDANQLGTPGPQ